MVLIYEQNLLEEESEGLTELTLLALKYVGEKPTMAVNNLRAQGYWPGTTSLTKNRWYITLVPDQGLDYYESSGQVEIVYDKAGIAKALLDSQNLPSAVFGMSSNRRLQERVFEELGLENVGLGEERYEEYRDQLQEIAGIEEDESESSSLDFFTSSRVDKLIDNHTRSELQDMAEDLGHEDVESAGKTDLAEYIAEAEDEEDEE